LRASWQRSGEVWSASRVPSKPSWWPLRLSWPSALRSASRSRLASCVLHVIFTAAGEACHIRTEECPRAAEMMFVRFSRFSLASPSSPPGTPRPHTPSPSRFAYQAAPLAHSARPSSSCPLARTANLRATLGSDSQQWPFGKPPPFSGRGALFVGGSSDVSRDCTEAELRDYICEVAVLS